MPGDGFSYRVSYRFQWVFCQLETLRHVVEADVRERVLKNINEDKRNHARRLLHCLSVSTRPLRVEELAEILMFDIDKTKEGITKFHTNRRPKDPEEAVLSICSSLITIVENGDSRVVQFSHFSVKEFLTSNHLASSSGDLSQYHVLPGPAHTILAQVCLGILLHVDDRNVSPLAKYAAQHWVAHAQFQDVSSHVQDGMKSLFNIDRPHFAAWVNLYDIDGESERPPSKMPSPLYYSALCGFHDLVQHLAVKYPQHVNAIGGSYRFPLIAALCRNHLRVAELLLEHGGRIDLLDTREQAPLHRILERRGQVAINGVRFLLERGADVNAPRDDRWTPLHLAAHFGEFSVVQMLLDHQADANSRNDDGQAPLHLLSRREMFEDGDDGSDLAKLLLEYGAYVNAKDKDKGTPLHMASYAKRLEVARVLLNHGANIHAENNRGETPWRIALNTQEDGTDVAQLLLEHRIKSYARDKYDISAPVLACGFGKQKIGRVRLGDTEKLEPENNEDQSAFRLWIEGKDYSGA